jgi:2-polyprenyl-3-methyl-5-hydroxy-6-metoxy-1,4-benzoquinol methylase
MIAPTVMVSAARGATAMPVVGCPLCHGCSTVPLERSGEIRVDACAQCGVAFVTPAPTLPELEHHYNDAAYYAEWMTTQRLARRDLWRERLQIVKDQRHGGKLLDVGCGDGGFLEAARTAGFDCAGTELSAYAVEEAGRRLGLPITAGPLRSIGYAAGSFDLVTMWHVLEHLEDPTNELREVYRLLRPGGLLFVAVPNRLSHLFNVVYRVCKGRPIRLYTPGEKELHLFHFTPESLARVLTACGFRLRTMGLDVEDVDWRKRTVDRLARAWFHLTGVNRSMAMLAVAEKPA